MEIKLGNYIITRDSYQYILAEEKPSKIDPTKLTKTNVGYYPKLAHLVKRLFELEVMQSDVKTLDALDNKMDEYALHLSDMITALNLEPESVKE